RHVGGGAMGDRLLPAPRFPPRRPRGEGSPAFHVLAHPRPPARSLRRPGARAARRLTRVSRAAYDADSNERLNFPMPSPRAARRSVAVDTTSQDTKSRIL